MFVVSCPHCFDMIEILEINCKIFRHGYFIESFQQIPPHSSKEECEKWISEGKIYGCGKPFMLYYDNEWMAKECDYI